ncbi:Plant invertase/pectin methylesterase inhibitor superfamily protein [Euphorbia peplus]|nr:Plant invertase/pectin methylesterase inhibitor superfamily protein [Euphorbia peplus]
MSLFNLHPPPPPTISNPRYYCKKAADSDPNISYDFCIRLFESRPHSKLEELVHISMKAALSNSTNIKSYISKLVKNQKNLDRYSRGALQDCYDLYSSANSRLHEAVYDVKSKDYRKANVDVSASMDTSATCEDGFKDIINKGMLSPLTNQNAVFFQLNAILLSFINMLQ